MSKKYAQMILQSLITLASASLGLVAALAWNDAIKATIKKVFETDDSLAGLYTYAVLATVTAIVIILILTRIAAKIGGEAVVSREAEG
jgi:hypothetical protein